MMLCIYFYFYLKKKQIPEHLALCLQHPNKNTITSDKNLLLNWTLHMFGTQPRKQGGVRGRSRYLARGVVT